MLAFKKYEESLRIVMASVPLVGFFLLSDTSAWYEGLRHDNSSLGVLLFTCLVFMTLCILAMVGQVEELKTKLRTFPLFILGLFWSQNFFGLYSSVLYEFTSYYDYLKQDIADVHYLQASAFLTTVGMAFVFSVIVLLINEYLKSEGRSYIIIKWIFITVVFVIFYKQNCDMIDPAVLGCINVLSWIDENILYVLGQMPEFDKPISSF